MLPASPVRAPAHAVRPSLQHLRLDHLGPLTHIDNLNGRWAGGGRKKHNILNRLIGFRGASFSTCYLGFAALELTGQGRSLAGESISWTNAFFSVNYSPALPKEGHGPPPGLAAMLRLPSCEETCEVALIHQFDVCSFLALLPVQGECREGGQEVTCEVASIPCQCDASIFVAHLSAHGGV